MLSITYILRSLTRRTGRHQSAIAAAFRILTWRWSATPAPQPPSFDCILALCGGGEIRTHEALANLPVFETGALDQLSHPTNEAAHILSKNP